MNRTALMAAVTLSLVGPGGATGSPDTPPGILGYSPKAAAVQRDVEKRYRAIPSAEEAHKWHRHFTAVPHPATSKANDQMAEYIAEQWRQQGLEDVVIRRYDVLSSNPREVKVEMVAPVPALDPAYATATGDRTIDFPFEKYGDKAVGEAFRRVIEDTGLFGRSTAREMARLFVKMAKGELVSKEASDTMIAILRKQQVNDRFPRYLGEGVGIAHKTGDGQPWVANDAGIVWVQGQPLALVVFTGHHRGTRAEMHDAVARVAAAVVHHYGGDVDPAGLK